MALEDSDQTIITTAAVQSNTPQIDPDATIVPIKSPDLSEAVTLIQGQNLPEKNIETTNTILQEVNNAGLAIFELESFHIVLDLITLIDSDSYHLEEKDLTKYFSALKFVMKFIQTGKLESGKELDASVFTNLSTLVMNVLMPSVRRHIRSVDEQLKAIETKTKNLDTMKNILEGKEG